MDENAKTFSFVGGALLMGLIAWIAYPRLPQPKTEDMRGKELFAEFTDPFEATSLEIFRWDESTGKVEPFQVAHVNDRWCIPSHHNYPADAKDHLAEAATSVIGLKVLDVVSRSPGDHELFGVVDPDPKTLKPGQTGVGTRVTMRGKDNNLLLSLIVGKAVEGKDGLRYVRCAGQDPVYVVALKTDKLTTRFEDWIEEDLLKLNTWDVKQVQVYDYSLDVVLGQLSPRNRIVLDYDDKDAKWSLGQCDVFTEKGWQPEPLAESEELNTTKLNDMKWALDDLKIVDVVPKPKGLSAALKGEGQLDEQAVDSLGAHGFHLLRGGLYSSQGEITVQMKDGVQYVLRFGNVATGTRGTAGAEQSEKGEQSASSSAGVNRYLFVMAEFNADAIPKPELEPLPELPGEAAQQPGNQAAETQQEQASEQAPDGDDQPQPAAPSEQAQPPAAASEPSAEAAGSQPADTAAQPAPPTELPKTREEIQKERERIEKENQRKQEEYDKKLEAGRKRVQELNERFADWYYVISDEVYRKIHLGRADIVQAKKTEEGTETSTGADQPSTEPAAQTGPDAETSQPATEPVGTAGQMPTGEASQPSGSAAPPANGQPPAAAPSDQPTPSGSDQPGGQEPAEQAPVGGPPPSQPEPQPSASP